MIRLTATRPAGALLGLMTLGVLTGCSGPPADDPSSALRAVCGEDAEIVGQDDHPLDGLLSGDRLAPEINSEQDAFFSGNGVTLGWATSEDVDNTHGILVEILPLDDGEADTSPFEPLEDDGRETCLGYPED